MFWCVFWNWFRAILNKNLFRIVRIVHIKHIIYLCLSKGTKRRSSLIYMCHNLPHWNSENKYACEYCDKSYTQLHNLKKHISICHKSKITAVWYLNHGYLIVLYKVTVNFILTFCLHLLDIIGRFGGAENNYITLLIVPACFFLLFMGLHS